MAFVLLWMHTLGHILPHVGSNYFKRPYLLAGLISLLGITGLTVLSLRYMRNVAFEFFLVSHIICTM
jgi:ferric-chelate reductase